MFRTDANNNPTAFTVDVAKQAGLVLGVDYVPGSLFPPPNVRLVTAKLLGDPVAITIRVIDKIGYYTESGAPRWTYIAIPPFVWGSLNATLKLLVIGFHYKNEGGTAMQGLFPEIIDVPKPSGRLNSTADGEGLVNGGR